MIIGLFSSNKCLAYNNKNSFAIMNAKIDLPCSELFTHHQQFLDSFLINSADYYLSPLFLRLFGDQDIEVNIINELISNVFQSQKNLIFYQGGDYKSLLSSLSNYIVIKESSAKSDASFCIPYKIPDSFQEKKPISKARKLVSFTGYINNSLRRSLKNVTAKQQFRETQFFWIQTQQQQERLRKYYLQDINDSKFVLCPRGYGLNSVRFFEVMKMGRIPVLISDNTKLPFEWLINYPIVRVPEDDVRNFMDYLDDKDVEEKSILIKQIYNEYLAWHPQKWLELILTYLFKK